MNIKNLIKKIPFVKSFYSLVAKNFIRPMNIIKIGTYTTLRTLKYSGLKKGITGWKASMRVSSHIIEKGLTMPEPRLGFGQIRLQSLANEILRNENKFHEPEILIAVGIIKEYSAFHNEKNYKLQKETQYLIDKIRVRFPDVEPLKQINTNKANFFSKKNASFPDFAKSRHSVRNFSGVVSEEQIIQSISLALTAPSACNRQATNCHIYSNKSKVQEILKLQNGNRGFGHLIPQICILTVDIRMVGIKEQNDAFINAGIFAMNLCYSFHYFEVGCCILNWSNLPKEDRKLKRIASIPTPETIILIMAIGSPADEFKITRSTRRNISEAIYFHK